MKSINSQKSKTGFFRTINNRFAVVLSIAIVSCLLIIEIISFTNMYGVVNKKGREMMELACEKAGSSMDEDYGRLLYISQAMSSTGVAGRLFEKYLTTENYLQRYNAALDLDREVSNLLFTTGDAFAVYYDESTGHNYLEAIQRLRGNRLDEDALHILNSTAEIDYHSVHRSFNKLSRPYVVSIKRSRVAAANDDVVAYIEYPVDVDGILSGNSDEATAGYMFVQLGSDGLAGYSTSAEIPEGTDLSAILKTGESFGTWNNYKWQCRRSDYGFTTVIMQPSARFYQDAYSKVSYVWVGLAASILLVLLTIKLLADMQRSDKRKSALEKEILYYQINPHFLLNTLNSAYWLSKTDKDNIGDYIARLTSILRYSLGRDNSTSTLRHDLDMMKSYLVLQSYRHDFTYSMDVEEGEYLETIVPRLFIQPVLENSIEHGMDEGGALNMSVYCRAHRIFVKVADNGTGVGPEILEAINNPSAEADEDLGIGLRYVRVMLRSVCGEDFSIKMMNTRDSETGSISGTEFSISFPEKIQEND